MKLVLYFKTHGLLQRLLAATTVNVASLSPCIPKVATIRRHMHALAAIPLQPNSSINRGLCLGAIVWLLVVINFVQSYETIVLEVGNVA